MAQAHPKGADRHSRIPYQMWLVPPPVRRHLPKQMLQFLLLPLVLAIALIAFALTVGTTFGAPASDFVHSYTDIAVPNEPPLAQTTYLYDRNGKLITTLHAEVNRTPVSLSKISPDLQHAVIAIEDRNFYRHGGVDFQALVRAAVADVSSGKIVQGGSTITQQYVKLVYTGSERTLSRKLKEAVLAEKISRKYSKAQILEKYLNLVYFGHGAYGAEAAAETYFGVPASKVSVAQAALLAGLIQAPADYDPLRHRAAAKGRRDVVLQVMAQQGYITHDQAAQMSATPVKVLKHPKAGPTAAAYFVDYVSRFLQHKMSSRDTFTGGLQVTTTLDWNMQRAAERAVASHLSQPGDPAAALVAIDPRTGEIRAMVGGRDFTRAKFNLATQAHRQTGSAFKVFTYTAAMQERIDPHAVMSGPPSLTIADPRCQGPKGPWQVSNFADESAGTMSVLDSLAHSVNTIFAQLVLDVGPSRVAQVATQMGIRSKLQSVCSITLGSQAVTPLDMAVAYSTLAARGVRHWPQAVQQVKSPSGEVLLRENKKGTRVLRQNDADQVVYAMQGVIQHGTGTAANIGRPAA
ncbi:MAG TPA: transglycosylase domain-containing protein, partial [Acidimicrobiales bacterium]|nr:transglycosylase domain-containing protein [Acidimicrobiales bacterium]